MKMTWIEPGALAASSLPFMPEDIAALAGQGTRAIVSLTEHPITRFRGVEEALAARAIASLNAPIDDHHAPSCAQADQILAWIDRQNAAGRPVLVHCNAGVGRTGTVLHAYFIGRGLDFAAANAAVRRVRSQSTLLSERQRAFLHQYVEHVAARKLE